MKRLALLAVLLPLLAAPAIAETTVEEMMKDRVLGAETAPITIVEYASMTCPSCKAFHDNSLETVKKELVETGKARFVFRDFPLDKYAVKAAMLSRCAPPDMYHDVVAAIYTEQPKWTKMKNPIDGLTEIGKAAGMDLGTIGACLGNADLEEAILKGMKEAQEGHQVKRTPTFLFREGEKWVDEYPAFTDILEKTRKPHGHDLGHGDPY